MSNTYFRFKQFTIHQDRCAMKVSTDACIAGAWTNVPAGARRILDIGAGTGLLSLMLAQKHRDIVIDAVELDEHAAVQATENVAASPWAGRLNVIHADASGFRPEEPYDFIISNPPFFNDSLLGHRVERNLARHTQSLSYAVLFDILSNNLSDRGEASILLPFAEHELWKNLLKKNGWSITRKLIVHPTAEKSPNRIVSICSKQIGPGCYEEHLYIRSADGSYTQGFSDLMKPYYLDK